MIMPYIELAGAIYLGLLSVTFDAEGWLNTIVLKFPAPVLGFLFMADALSRLGWIGGAS